MRFNLNPMCVREDDTFGEDSTISNPQTQNLIDRREDELTLLLLEEGMTLQDFDKSLEVNPEGIVEWVRLSLATRH